MTPLETAQLIWQQVFPTEHPAQGEAIELIAKAIEEARQEALEEAASACEQSVVSDIPEFSSERLQCVHDAKLCRALNSKNKEKE